MEETLVRLKDRRLKLMNVQEWAGQGAAAMALLSAGSAGLHGAHTGPSWLPVADIAVAVVLLAAIGREVKAVRAARSRSNDPDTEGEGGGIGWVSLLGGVGCFLEWGTHLAGGGKVLSAVLLTGVLNVGQGLWQPRLEQRRRERRYVRLGDGGVDARLSRVRHFQATWAQVASVMRDEGSVLLTSRDGRTCRMPARRYENFAELADAVVRHARAHQVQVVDSTEPAGAHQAGVS
jgi:hypothetical protein